MAHHITLIPVVSAGGHISNPLVVIQVELAIKRTKAYSKLKMG